ncbi:hypothetical protein O181_045862 [Austropuccinia psidii MF-1]|uniref:Uncharacterized protein n=1 Tax=Austropuccinia psidii MF-1 TaxID=1389203 RepID=A0A9Q3DUP4_9BASI|nr:hypothetical protein [Austropuccinia psidii MF-1]
MSPPHLRNLGIPRNQPKDRQGLFIARRPGTGHLGQNSGLQDTDRNHTHYAFNFQFRRNLKPEDWKDMDQFLLLHQLLKDLFQWSMDK